MSEQRGRYVRVEGCDGAGKTTQIRHLQEYSEEKGIDAVFLREPGATHFGGIIRSIILTDHTVHLSPMTELLLFTSDRNHTCEEIIMPALGKDQLVVSDRGLESTVNYQSAGGGLSKETIMSISREVLPARYIYPDTLALLSITKETRRKRLGRRFTQVEADKIESRDDGYADRVYDGYQALGELDYTTVIDGNVDEDQVFEQLKPVVFGQYLRDHTGIYLPTHTAYSTHNT